MELRKVNKLRSPMDSTKIRIEGEVHYDDRPGKPETYWFDIPQKYADDIATSGNPWLTCLLPLAMKLKEPLKLCLPVDRLKLKNAFELIRLWKLWYPELHVISIDAEIIEEDLRQAPRKTAAFFSGGVDSFFTVLSHENMVPGKQPMIDDLLIVWGMDIPIKNNNEFQRLKAEYTIIAQEMNKNLIDIVTNIRETRLETAGWGTFYFGSAFCSCALMLENRFERLLFSSGGENYNAFWKWGSHPFTDPFLSTSRTNFHIDGIGYNRIDRLKYIAQFEVVQKHLRVCYISKTDKNCCNCEKCYRTMLALELLGCLDKFDSFERKQMDYKKLQFSFINSSSIKEFYDQIYKLALEKERTDITENISKGFQFSRRAVILLNLAKWMANKRFLWRLAVPIENFINTKIRLK